MDEAEGRQDPVYVAASMTDRMSVLIEKEPCEISCPSHYTYLIFSATDERP
jgi:hypothetical protein